MRDHLSQNPKQNLVSDFTSKLDGPIIEEVTVNKDGKLTAAAAGISPAETAHRPSRFDVKPVPEKPQSPVASGRLIVE